MKIDWKLKNADPYFERVRNHPKQRIIRNIFLLLLVFFGVMLVTQILQIVASLGIMLIAGVQKKAFMENVDLQIVLSLFLTLLCIATNLVFCFFVEKRSAGTLFMTRRKCIPHYLIGALLGFAMMGAVTLIAWLSGAITFDGVQTIQNPFIMVLLFVGWMIQGFSEELSYRGWLMTSIGTHHSIWIAVALSAISFAVMHGGNDGFSIFAIVNLILFGVVTALYVLRTGSIWGAAAMHSVWNWAQGNFFGLQVSGIPTDSTILKFSQSGEVEWIGGGTFGLEAGAATTIILLIMITVLLLMQGRQVTQEVQDNGTV